jgi:hypothetical protein
MEISSFENLARSLLLAAVVVAAIIAAALVGFGIWRWRSQPQTFAAWLVEHCKTCRQCDESMNRNPDVPLCEAAFERLKSEGKP